MRCVGLRFRNWVLSSAIRILGPYSIGMPNKEPGETDLLQGAFGFVALQTHFTMGPLHG